MFAVREIDIRHSALRSFFLWATVDDAASVVDYSREQGGARVGQGMEKRPGMGKIAERLA